MTKVKIHQTEMIDNVDDKYGHHHIADILLLHCVQVFSLDGTPEVKQTHRGNVVDHEHVSGLRRHKSFFVEAGGDQDHHQYYLQLNLDIRSSVETDIYQDAKNSRQQLSDVEDHSMSRDFVFLKIFFDLISLLLLI